MKHIHEFSIPLYIDDEQLIKFNEAAEFYGRDAEDMLISTLKNAFDQVLEEYEVRQQTVRWQEPRCTSEPS